jgi:phosphatidylserine decarboxylase
MSLARGSQSWILSALIPAVVFLILFVLFPNQFFSIVFLFITVALFLITGFFLMFFRDPEREISDGVVVCADGRIREIQEIKDKDVEICTRISTFMNVYNVHVNRMPFDGIIKEIRHSSGFHLPAFKKESEKNERVTLVVDSKIGVFKVVQIAGTLARRIVPYVKNGDKLKKGERIGIIRLGSRVDVYLPREKTRVCVKVGEMVRAGEDKLAEVND